MKVLLLYSPSTEHRAALERAAPHATWVVAESQAEAAEAIVDAEVVLGNHWFLESLDRARKLRWMQTPSMGVDWVLEGAEALRDVVVTCARGVYDDEVAEHATALLLALARGLHRSRDEQRREAWNRAPLRTVAGMKALVLGQGGVGRGIGRRLTALGARPEGVRRVHQGPPAIGAEGYPVHGPATWRERLPEMDAVVLALPLTAETRRLVGAAEVARLPRRAFVVNVGRGGTLDEAALLESLRTDALAGAALDVFESEPLPPGHPAWSEGRLLLTPHVARSPETGPRRFEPLFVENVRRFAAGEPLLHVVDRGAGY